MLLKWTLIVFTVAALGLYVLGKVLALLNPPRPNRPSPPALQRVNRAFRWTLIIPVVLAAALLAIALATAP